MSGKPNRYASDPVKNRDQYMEALNLRANIDDMNLQANKTYKATGQLPPVSQMPETRTTTEILADNERLKIELIKDLAPIGDTPFAQSVIQRIQNSPLNTTGSLFTFFAQRAPEIVIQLKKLYKYKIKGDANDVEIMASFIEDMFSKTKAMTTSVSSFFSQSESKKHNINAINDFADIQRLFEDIGRRLRLKAEPTSPLGRMIKRISYTLVGYVNYLTYLEMFDYTIDLVSKDPDRFNIVNGRNTLDEFYDAFKRYNEILEEFPKAETLYALLKQLDLTIKNRNQDLTIRLLTEFQSLVDKVDEMNVLMDELARLKNLLDNLINPEDAPVHDIEELDDEDNVEDVQQGPPPAPPAPPAPPVPLQPVQQPAPPDRNRFTDDEIQQVRDDRIALPINDPSRGRLIRLVALMARYNVAVDINNQNNAENYKNQIIELINEIPQDILTHINMEGRGLKKRRGRPRGCGIVKQKPYSESVKANVSYDKGIMESPRFVKFGKYLVNNHKLNNDDIFALKQPSGGALQEFPSVRLSKHLSNVIKKMVGGGVPSYNDLNGLSEPEKVYLHNVAKRSNIVDKFSIPAPNKDQYEKDIHEFEVLKGEIMAGNDSKELIKKFKLHLMKLSKMGSLPKKEVTDIMEELLQLGY